MDQRLQKNTWSSKVKRTKTLRTHQNRILGEKHLPAEKLSLGKIKVILNMSEPKSDLVLYVVKKGLSKDTKNDWVINIEPQSIGWKFQNNDLGFLKKRRITFGYNFCLPPTPQPHNDF